MLPNATAEQKIATGFHRNAMTNEEGGVDPEESLYEVLVDRVNTTATVWLGTTLALRAVPQPQVRSVHAEGLLTACSPSSPTRTTRAATFGDGTRYFEPTLDLATPEQEARASSCRRRSTGSIRS